MIFVILLCCLLGLGVFGYNLDNQVSHVQSQTQETETLKNGEKEYKDRKNEHISYGNLYLSSGDLLSSQFIYKTLIYLYNFYPDTETIYPYIGPSSWNWTINNLLLETYTFNADNSLTYVNTINTLYITKNLYQDVYIYDFSFKYNSSLIFTIEYIYEGRLQDGSSNTDYIDFFMYNTSTNYQFNYILKEDGQTNKFFYNVFNNDLVNQIASDSQAFMKGKAIGYEEAIEGVYGGETYDNIYQEAKHEGWLEGVQYAQSQNQTALTIFEGILSVGFLPVNVFLGMFDYEVFGISIAGLVSSLITIVAVIVIVRFIFGGKSNDK